MYFESLLVTFRYFWVLFGTFGYSLILFNTFGYFGGNFTRAFLVVSQDSVKTSTAATAPHCFRYRNEIKKNEVQS